MIFHNRLIDEELSLLDGIKIPFHTLNEGDSYISYPGGKIRTVIRKEADFIKVKRYDGWITHHDKGCYVWDRLVIKVEKI